MTFKTDFWSRFPLKVMLAVTLACLLVGESYPFSNFPMFGSFSEKSYYVYLADQNGTAIPAKTFGVETNGIKKAYDRALRDAKKALPKKGQISPAQDREFADQTLRYLIQRTKKIPPELSALRLVRVDLQFADGKVNKTSRTAGEVTLR